MNEYFLSRKGLEFIYGIHQLKSYESSAGKGQGRISGTGFNIASIS